MPEDAKTFLKKYWLAIIIALTTNFFMSFFGYISASRVREYRFNQLENNFDTFKTSFQKEIKPKLDVMFYMHGLSLRGEALQNEHDHKKKQDQFIWEFEY